MSDQVTIEVRVDGMRVASVTASEEFAHREAYHYAMMYEDEGDVVEVRILPRRKK